MKHTSPISDTITKSRAITSTCVIKRHRRGHLRHGSTKRIDMKTIQEITGLTKQWIGRIKNELENPEQPS